MTSRKILRFALAACIVTLGCAALPAQAVKYSSRVLLIPLDDRPPCLQFPVKMGLVGDVEVVTPPREMLGRFTDFGRSDEIVEWLGKQDLRSFDAAVISLDMLAYGGLVASRVYSTSEKDAARRIRAVVEMRRKAPRLKIYGSSVIMRLAPTADGKNEAYREKLAKWAEVSADVNEKAETARLESEIPPEALKNYKLARARDLEINRHAIDLTKKRVFDYLILSQDDAKARGVHVADRESLIEYMNASKLGDRVAVQPGADEVSMLLLSRAVTDKYNYHPKIKAIYSSEKLADQLMPFEDRPLRKTVSFHIKAAGGVEVSDEKQADVLFYVYASRFEPGRAESFAKEIIDQVAAGRRLIVGDIDPKGDVQGADPKFTEAILDGKGFRKLFSYASWNTAGNTIGTTLPQGILVEVKELAYTKSKRNNPAAWMEKNEEMVNRVQRAKDWFMLNRLIDDYLYHAVVRPEALRLIKSRRWNSFRLTAGQTTELIELSMEALKTPSADVSRKYFQNEKCAVEKLSFVLPWNRTFEAEIDFENPCPFSYPHPTI